MRVFKFGGASVNSGAAVRNMADIVQGHLGNEPLVVVVSAMGKTTNKLERLVPGIATEEERQGVWQEVVAYHRDIASALLPDEGDVQQRLGQLLDELEGLCHSLPTDADHYNYCYDQVVAYGELLSTTIIAAYLNHLGTRTLWVDARRVVATDGHHREGRVDWGATQAACRSLWSEVAEEGKAQVVLTQGFIGKANDGSTITLGREGSDYTAAVLAYCLDAESVTIWKDVPGFLNADPKYFADTVKIAHIPYNEAIELAYYGASVIHPKTVKPLQNRGIPLFIKSFLAPQSEGSAVGDYATIEPETPLYIVKDNQLLLSITPRDFSFIAEDNLQTIFGELNALGVKANLMQNSALSFSICLDDQRQLTERLIERLGHLFRVRYNRGLRLITIRYYTDQSVERLVAGRPVLLEQRSRQTAQVVVA